jgi:hypothetical protein
VFLLFLLVAQCFKVPEEEVLTWTTVFSDNFDRANSADISPFSIQVYGNGEADIYEGSLRYGGDAFWAIRATGVPGDTIRVSAKCTIVSGQPWFGISAKSRDLGSEWRYQELYGFWVDADSMGIYEIETGTESPAFIAKKASPREPINPYIITLVVIGQEIKGYFEDTVTGIKDSIFATASFQAIGTIASLNGTNGETDTVLIDNFKIETGKMSLR